MESIEHRIDALAASFRREEGGRDGVAAAVPELRLAIDAVEARTRSLHEEQQRLEDELARDRPMVDAQTVVAQALDQVRSLRERVEARLSALEGQVAETDHRLLQVAEERALLRGELASHEELLRGLIGVIESHRETFIEHVRRATAAAEDAGRRQMQEIDRRTRSGRELLTRLTEESAERAKEQPL
jgi:chromosome segregation ATPase